MRPKSSNAKSRTKASAEAVVKDIRRATRRHFSTEDKIRIVLDGLRGDFDRRLGDLRFFGDRRGLRHRDLLGRLRGKLPLVVRPARIVHHKAIQGKEADDQDERDQGKRRQRRPGRGLEEPSEPRPRRPTLLHAIEHGAALGEILRFNARRADVPPDAVPPARTTPRTLTGPAALSCSTV